ncbi:unnamed protein product [Penicillium camemberti]|uniref:Str. FM013 n=1 Tax=Penicillium camemberti (strain FM 013) TaxID=1429867 RepID=A0A0G4NYX9_PENC3|nr:unnamed protein product [Penicillium camemberti]
MHLSIGIEHIEYIKENIYRVFASIDVSQLPTASIQAQLLHQQEQKRVVQALFRSDPLLLSVLSIWLCAFSFDIQWDLEKPVVST